MHWCCHTGPLAGCNRCPCPVDRNKSHSKGKWVQIEGGAGDASCFSYLLIYLRPIMNDMFGFYGNSMLDVWAIFSAWRIKHVICNDHAVFMFLAWMHLFDRRAGLTWQSISSEAQAHKCCLPHVQMGFKDVCNQPKHCQVQRNELHFHIWGAFSTIYWSHGSNPLRRWNTFIMTWRMAHSLN